MPHEKFEHGVVRVRRHLSSSYYPGLERQVFDLFVHIESSALKLHAGVSEETDEDVRKQKLAEINLTTFGYAIAELGFQPLGEERYVVTSKAMSIQTDDIPKTPYELNSVYFYHSPE